MPLLIAIVFGLLNVAQQAEAKGLSCEKAVRLLLKKEKLNPKVASIYFSKCQKSKKGTELQWHRRYQAAKKLLTSMESLKGSSWRFCDDQTGYHIDTCHEHLRRAIKILDIKVLQLGNKWWDKKEEKRKKWEKKHRENNEREMKKLLEKGRKETKEAEKLIEKLKL
jgi:hypothetical protein